MRMGCLDQDLSKVNEQQDDIVDKFLQTTVKKNKAKSERESRHLAEHAFSVGDKVTQCDSDRIVAIKGSTTAATNEKIV